MPNKSITVTEEEVVNVISDRQDKKGGDQPYCVQNSSYLKK